MTNAPTHRFDLINGLRLHHLDFGGEGRPIVFLHGVTGHAWMWAEVAADLTAVGRPLSLDFRGYGDSQWSAELAYSTEDHADDVGAFIDGLGAAQVDLVGLSWGGLVALAVSARRPDLVHRLAIVDIPPSFDSSPTEIPNLPHGFADHASAWSGERGANPNAPDSMIDVMAHHGTRPGPGGGLVKKHDPHFIEVWPFRDDDRWDELQSVEMPVLVVHAEKSYVQSGAEAERMAEVLSDGTLVQIADAGHLVPVENPIALAEALASFLGTS